MEWKRIFFIAFACLLFISTQLCALDPDKPLNRYQSKEWGVSDGLPSDTVWAIAQTPEGYLWIGTPNGLVRFDGVTFKVFGTKTHPGIIDNAVHTSRMMPPVKPKKVLMETIMSSIESGSIGSSGACNAAFCTHSAGICQVLLTSLMSNPPVRIIPTDTANMMAA